MREAMMRILIRMLVFAVVGIAGTLIVNRGAINLGGVAFTLSFFFLMNIAFEVFMSWWRKNRNPPPAQPNK